MIVLNRGVEGWRGDWPGRLGHRKFVTNTEEGDPRRSIEFSLGPISHHVLHLLGIEGTCITRPHSRCGKTDLTSDIRTMMTILRNVKGQRVALWFENTLVWIIRKSKQASIWHGLLTIYPAMCKCSRKARFRLCKVLHQSLIMRCSSSPSSHA